ncbi:TetR/AcrR family transcriptional regulator [Shouchella rhizosphaerae]|uniref:TetR/AcrR family transcriptional regulator n=1 Tax=Shouchella rhizosphaerae TaxID=866786 RepID=UPI003F7D488C
MNTNDLRARRTRKLLFEALIELLLQPKAKYKEITVQKICDKAMVHRSTFYMHYRDKYDLLIHELEQKEEELTGEERRLRILFPFTTMEKQTTVHFLDSIMQRNEDDEYLFNLVQDSIKRLMREDILQLSKGSGGKDVPLDIQAEFLASTITTLKMWWNKNHHTYTPEEMDRYYRHLCNKELFNF